MQNRYETVFITTPVLSEDQVKETVNKFREIIKSSKGTIIDEENWGLKKLAYPIEKKSTGFYYLIQFESEGDIIRNLETEYKRDERIIRYLTIKMDKYAIEYSEKKRAQRQKQKEKEE